MGDSVLFLDDEQSILSLLKRLFLDDDLNVIAYSRGEDALKAIREEEVAVIVSDNLMPGMRGTDFLQQAKILSPDSVRIMLTGHGDMQVAVDAINKGEVHRFLAKPWDNGELRQVVLDSIERYHIVKSLRKADEYSLYSLAQTIELKDSYTKGHCDRVAKYAVAIAEALDLEKDLVEHIRRGSWLHDCGKIGIPEAILNYPGPLSEDQMAIVKKHPCWGADVARLAHLAQPIINIILYHHERYDGKGYPVGLKGEEIPIEARVVNVADVYDALTSDRSYRSRMTKEAAREVMLRAKGTYSDPRLVDIFLAMVEEVDDGRRDQVGRA